ncbi:hypothetical protein PpBr36_01516 [Pyricularia pennisetigena]|uniref:hypothetical protein n=1 Tax=Pyricularia pennisetigena TaxID=1578925 RepID=UPI00114EB2D9|nr:hypothetical protein PpBr36_01516 [Pyricularia pennisetigena]TLS29487.1 hypothetical protein PpBr36_01516 [Pyricularia pennisetigena]
MATDSHTMADGNTKAKFKTRQDAVFATSLSDSAPLALSSSEPNDNHDLVQCPVKTNRSALNVTDALLYESTEAAVGDAEVAAGFSASQAQNPRQTPATRHKMSCGTQSTTQNNEDRSSYDKYRAIDYSSHPPLDNPQDADDASPLLSTAPLDSPPPSLPEEDDDDTGGVLFRLSQTDGGETQMSVDNGPAAADAAESQNYFQRAIPMMLPPETPANANPFAGKGQGTLLPGSEMFRHTQFSAAARAGLSPTSSRPSPNMFAHNSISPNFVDASPLQARGARHSPPAPTSSPQPLTGRSSCTSDIGDDLVPQYGLCSEVTEIPESPQPKSHRGRRVLTRPVGQYEPMKDSQERRERAEHRPDRKSDPDWSDDDFVSGRIRSRRVAGIQALKSTALNRKNPREDEVEVPSTNKKKRSTSGDLERYPAERRAKGACSDESTQDLSTPGAHSVTDSQEQVPTEANTSSREAIPETSPPRVASGRQGRSPAAENSVDQSYSQLPSELAITASISAPSTKAKSSFIPASTVPASAVSTPETGMNTRPRKRREKSTPLIPLSSSAGTLDLPRRDHSPGQQEHLDEQGSPASSPATVNPQNTMSDLSSLGTTPGQSNETTPATEDSVAPGGVEADPRIESSPADVKSRRRVLTKTCSSKPTNASRSTRTSRKSGIRSPTSSLDELAGSPAFAQAPGHNLRASRLGRTSVSTTFERAPTSTPIRGPKIFDSMVFAISFSSKKPRDGVEYNGITEQVSTIEKKIQQAGGRVLNNGFDELFESQPVQNAIAESEEDETSPADSDLRLTPTARSTGFTALIADSHHRKSKYMQALALGLPCLSARWVTTCIAKGKVVDWEPYLLCAGQSSFLGDAYRSRNLLPYDAVTAKLQDVVQRRSRLLADSKILIVMKKSEEVKKMAYIFLARALGASVSRVFTADEARESLRDAQDRGTPYDWVYVGKKSITDQLFEETPEAIFPMLKKGKKRKRTSATDISANPSAAPPPKRIRTLSDELVVQSLILGRLIESEEMEE